MTPRRSRALGLVAPALMLAALLAAPHGAAAEDAEALASARALVQAYGARFTQVDASVAEGLDSLYREDIRFTDPITSLEGLDALRRYFAHFARQSAEARFEISGEILASGEAAVFWIMIFPGEDEAAGHRVEGVSHLRFDDRIYAQRDYFDLGAAVYSRVPVLGWLTRRVNARLAPDDEPD